MEEIKAGDKQKKLLKWIVGNRTGVSSITMWTAVMNVDISDISIHRFDTPSDCDDFARCLNLYNECELTQDDLAKVSAMFPEWNGIVDNWQTLTDMYNRKDYSCFYKYIKSLTGNDLK